MQIGIALGVSVWCSLLTIFFVVNPLLTIKNCISQVWSPNNQGSGLRSTSTYVRIGVATQLTLRDISQPAG